MVINVMEKNKAGVKRPQWLTQEEDRTEGLVDQADFDSCSE